MLMMKKKLNDVYPYWVSGDGIFSDLETLEVPWQGEGWETSLDLVYFGNESGQKNISPLLRAMGELDSTKRAAIAKTAFDMFNTYWSKQWATLSLEYNPIENYNMIETESGSHSVEGENSNERTDDLTHRRTGTETNKTDSEKTRTDDLTHTQTGTDTTANTGTDTESEQVQGFNSTSWDDSNKRTKTLNTENEVTHDTEETDTGTVGEVVDATELLTLNTTEADTGTQATEGSHSESGETERELTRSGNIGVTTSQQMLESERALWQWNFFKNVVFKDLDSLLTKPKY